MISRTTAALALTLIVFGVTVACSGANPSATDQFTTIRYEAGGVELQLGIGWKHQDKEKKLFIESPDGSVRMIVFDPAQRGMEAGMAEVDQTITDRKNTGVDMRGKPIADGMHVQNYYGTGQVEGQQVQWMMTLVDKSTFEEPRLAMLTWGEPKSFASTLPSVLKILDGLRRIKTAH